MDPSYASSHKFIAKFMLNNLYKVEIYVVVLLTTLIWQQVPRHTFYCSVLL